jgi:phage-related tail fiber protein
MSPAPATAAVRMLSGEREPVRVATTGPITLSGLQTVDGVALNVNDRVLVKNQSDRRQNGIYTASAGVWYRANDATFTRSVSEGVTVQIQEGVNHGSQVWRFDSGMPVIGHDPIVLTFYLSASFSEDAQGIVDGSLIQIGEYADQRQTELGQNIDAAESAALARVAASSNAAAISAGQALGARNQAVAAEGRAQNLVDAATAAYVGFEPGTFYDLGRVTDTMQLFASDLGRVTDPS